VGGDSGEDKHGDWGVVLEISYFRIPDRAGDKKAIPWQLK
jgi:hypothetical protein